MIVLLFVGAGVLELAGLGLILWDLRGTRQALRRWAVWPQTVRPDTIRARMTAHPPSVTVEGQEPTPEERLQAIDDRLSQLASDLLTQWEKTLDELTNRVTGLEERLGTTIADIQKRNAAFIEAIGNAWRSSIGTILLVAGLILNVVANIAAQA